MTKIEQAKEFAHEAHDRIQQKRKYSGEPYWVHTDEVASIVESVAVLPRDEDMVVAAHLHDILEDVTPKYPAYSEGQIRVLFGERVLQYVKELTDVFTKENYPKLNRKERKRLERERVGQISPEAKTIKLADLISNTASIVSQDKDFARVYIREKLELLPYLADGAPTLLQRASMQTVMACGVLGIEILTVKG